MPHRDKFDMVTRARKLYQQYLVDIWVRIGETRLRYLQWAQCSDRVEQEDALDTYMALTLNPDMSIPGSPVLLPSSFIREPRFMQQKIHSQQTQIRKKLLIICVQ